MNFIKGHTSIFKNFIAGLTIVAFGLGMTPNAAAQDEGEETSAKGDAVLEEILVTGTRVIRDGFESPTPLTVIGEQEIEAATRLNIVDVLRTVPSFAGDQNSHGSARDASNGRQGQSNLSLRGLGAPRTLVLLDGHRVASGDIRGATNITDLPQGLISRIDIVTGGASAAYGSDAVAGVVNFILDTDFTGIKLEIGGGITDEGDNESTNASLQFGTEFSDGRGHFLVSVDYTDQPGIVGDERDWNRLGWDRIGNPAYVAGNGEPQFLVAESTGLSVATPGGLITTGSLRGTQFGPNGVPLPFIFGTVSGIQMIGGDWETSTGKLYVSLENEVERKNVFLRASYEITDDVEWYVQTIQGDNEAVGNAGPHFSLGNITIQSDNAFLDPVLAQTMLSAGESSFRMGSLHGDLPGPHGPGFGTVVERKLHSYSIGVKGVSQALDRNWTWDLFAQTEIADTDVSAFVLINPDLALAVDAVRDPSTATIVCRSTLTDPNNGCVPYNPMGLGVNGQSSIDYVTGNSTLDQRIKQNVISASASGEPFDSWAGPVSLAFGVEYRKQSVSGEVDSRSLDRVYQVGNYQPTFGSVKVTEGFVETVVPLAKSLEFNGAVRLTDYSTSGNVTTWKAGLIFRPTADLLLRAVRSRDIRAPSMEEYFLAGISRATVDLIDPFNNNMVVPPFLRTNEGNQNAKPEEADTTGLGIVYRPSWLEGFSASVDFYDIEINDAITNIGFQAIVDQCFQGNQDLCLLISRDENGTIDGLRLVPVNVATEETRGVDIEATYRTSAWSGDLAFRALATFVDYARKDDGITAPIDIVGKFSFDGLGPADSKWLISATYANDRFSTTLTGRGFGDGVYNNNAIECVSGCPLSTPGFETRDTNRIDGAFYLDVAFTYDFWRGEDDGSIQAYFTVQNIADKDPAVMGGRIFTMQANPYFHDQLGRVYYAGLRFRK